MQQIQQSGSNSNNLFFLPSLSFAASVAAVFRDLRCTFQRLKLASAATKFAANSSNAADLSWFSSAGILGESFYFLHNQVLT